MITITLDAQAEAKLERVVAMTGKPIEDVIAEAIDTQLDQLNEQKLNAEIMAYEQLHPVLKEKYLGQYVVIHEGRVVDADHNFEDIVLRVHHKYPNVEVLVRRVEETPDEEYFLRGVRGV